MSKERKLSIQQLPKDKEFLSCFTPRPGNKIIGVDINALEPHVLTHLSQDKNLLKFYGRGAVKNDIYLYVASQISAWKEKVRVHYDPLNPTPEGIRAAKEYAAKERELAKPSYLGWIYGMGAYKMHQDTELPIEECEQILSELDRIFCGTEKLYTHLRKEWEQTGGTLIERWQWDPIKQRRVRKIIAGTPGYIVNGRGRPICVGHIKAKDLTNSCVQSTGHDIFEYYLVLMNRRRREQKLDIVPYNVDVHDATYWQGPERVMERAAEIFKESFQELNDTLQWSVEFKGETKIGDNLGDFLQT